MIIIKRSINLNNLKHYEIFKNNKLILHKNRFSIWFNKFSIVQTSNQHWTDVTLLIGIQCRRLIFFWPNLLFTNATTKSTYWKRTWLEFVGYHHHHHHHQHPLSQNFIALSDLLMIEKILDLTHCQTRWNIEHIVSLRIQSNRRHNLYHRYQTYGKCVHFEENVRILRYYPYAQEIRQKTSNCTKVAKLAPGHRNQRARKLCLCQRIFLKYQVSICNTRHIFPSYLPFSYRRTNDCCDDPN